MRRRRAVTALLLGPALLSACAAPAPRPLVRPVVRPVAARRPTPARPASAKPILAAATPPTEVPQVQKAAITAAAVATDTVPAVPGSNVPLLGFRPMRGQTAAGGS